MAKGSGLRERQVRVCTKTHEKANGRRDSTEDGEGLGSRERMGEMTEKRKRKPEKREGWLAGEKAM